MGLLWGLVVLFFVLWLLGWTAFHVAGAAIHILLVVAIVLAVWNLIAGGRRTVG